MKTLLRKLLALLGLRRRKPEAPFPDPPRRPK